MAPIDLADTESDIGANISQPCLQASINLTNGCIQHHVGGTDHQVSSAGTTVHHSQTGHPCLTLVNESCSFSMDSSCQITKCFFALQIDPLSQSALGVQYPKEGRKENEIGSHWDYRCPQAALDQHQTAIVAAYWTAPKTQTETHPPKQKHGTRTCLGAVTMLSSHSKWLLKTEKEGLHAQTDCRNSLETAYDLKK